jgi:CubicO group peptidase (beta-lactamase class C family)
MLEGVVMPGLSWDLTGMGLGFYGRISPVPRLPLLVDPIRRIRVPRDLEAVTTVGREADPRDVGMTRDGVERIWAAVEALYRTGIHPAIAVCVRRDGQVVLDRAIGHGRGNGPNHRDGTPATLATPDTPFVIFSTAKAFTATVAHLLDQRGLIHINDRVCEYIPEFASHGKDGITIGHVLSHRAGVPNIPREALQLEHIDDRDFKLRTMCDARPRSRPGHALAYHAISGGFIIAEIVERVTGKDIRQVLGEEILAPLRFRWCNYGVRRQDVPLVARNYATGLPVVSPLSELVRRKLGVPFYEAVRLSNDPRFLTGVVPSGNVVTTANELSRFFEMLRTGGQLDGVRIFEPRTIRRAITEQSYHELDLTLGFPVRYSLGFMLGARHLSAYGPDTETVFGHLGFTNVAGWADPERGLSGAVITSGKPMFYPELPLMWAVMRRIGIEAPKVPEQVSAFTPTTGPFRHRAA